MEDNNLTWLIQMGYSFVIWRESDLFVYSIQEMEGECWNSTFLLLFSLVMAAPSRRFSFSSLSSGFNSSCHSILWLGTIWTKPEQIRAITLSLSAFSQTTSPPFLPISALAAPTLCIFLFFVNGTVRVCVRKMCQQEIVGLHRTRLLRVMSWEQREPWGDAKEASQKS